MAAADNKLNHVDGALLLLKAVKAAGQKSAIRIGRSHGIKVTVSARETGNHAGDCRKTDAMTGF
jgi:hypothetical protein